MKYIESKLLGVRKFDSCFPKCTYYGGYCCRNPSIGYREIDMDVDVCSSIPKWCPLEDVNE